MTVSVIIPTLDEERALPQTLAHTLTLGFEEVLVVDGGSRDRTIEIVRSLAGNRQWAIGDRQETGSSEIAPAHNPLPITPPLRLITSAVGRALQMNVGAAASRGDVLLFLHADTRLPDGAKQAIVGALQEPECVGGRFDLRFDRDCPLGRLIGCMINWRSRLSGIATGDQAIFVRREVFERMGGYAAIPLMEDIDLAKRLNRLGVFAGLYAQVVTSFRRWDTHGPIRTILLMWLLRFLYWTGVSPHTLSRWYAAVR